MSIAPRSFLPFINHALDGMVHIVETLGDTRVNDCPGFPNANSPYAILTHCIGVTNYWLGHVLAGRTITRDRDAEFCARGMVDEIRRAVQALQRQIEEDINHVQGNEPVRFPVNLHGQTRNHSQGDVLLHCYRELAQHHGQMELTRDILLSNNPPR